MHGSEAILSHRGGLRQAPGRLRGGRGDLVYFWCPWCAAARGGPGLGFRYMRDFCLLLFLPVPVCSHLLVPPPTSSRFLPLTPVSPTSSCLLLPLPSGFRGALWSLLGAFRKLFKGLLGASGGLFRGFVRPLGASWKLQGAFGGPLGVPGGLGGLLGDLLGASRRPVGCLVGVSWGRLRGSWDLLGPL